ncbi:very low-density lipoprotein receptor-like isoform X1 [Bolinopsis microptera]|uniref:very low-density lipoprotein receptor-like isoform X1 n=1 Tax=Bolinopsis microptera TaxID=2820187 RepID=UPI00307918F4
MEKCADGEQCFHASFVCSGDTKCNDGSDQTNCSERECQGNDTEKCADGEQCIHVDGRCDGDTDCYDGSDETNCSELGSSSFPFSPSWTTSFLDDPQDPGVTLPYLTTTSPSYTTWSITYSSESYSRDGSVYCPKGYWKCSNGWQCIKDSWRCDVYTHCYDGSDETNCPEPAIDGSECRYGYWGCSNGVQCIKDSWRCDGYTSCIDGSDETNCPVSGPASQRVPLTSPTRAAVEKDSQDTDSSAKTQTALTTVGIVIAALLFVTLVSRHSACLSL